MLTENAKHLLGVFSLYPNQPLSLTGSKSPYSAPHSETLKTITVSFPALT
ncbi:hypothetical protein VIBHAR_05369 [Vibrio campbellii ATCC BAA-1116]|uniref:Uncharacterized protein n=1 Tax=Vibrio campbellii (strain ATCC BAA-1116) TaxID=2902295 RepID=A7N7I5_VIBC1|nr:hypothetical protein VIBHAR_05369 [Vibrio campbellii ATCC BAA-1116]